MALHGESFSLQIISKSSLVASENAADPGLKVVVMSPT